MGWDLYFRVASALLKDCVEDCVVAEIFLWKAAKICIKPMVKGVENLSGILPGVVYSTGNE